MPDQASFETIDHEGLVIQLMLWPEKESWHGAWRLPTDVMWRAERRRAPTREAALDRARAAAVLYLQQGDDREKRRARRLGRRGPPGDVDLRALEVKPG